MKTSGFSLLEMFVVVAILSVISAAVFGTMNSSRIGLNAASEQINRQQGARMAMSRIVDELKATNPSWIVNSTDYPVVISNLGAQIDFYIPEFDDNNEISILKAVRYYFGGSQLLRREGSDIAVLANDIAVGYMQENIFPYFSFDNVDNTIINMRIPIVRDNTNFVLDSQVNLRNRQIELSEVSIAEIIEE